MRAYISASTEMDMGNRIPIKKQQRAILKREFLREVA